MTSTTARKSDITRTLRRILDPTRFPEGASNGWTTRQEGSRVEITLNFFSGSEDRTALDIIREHLDTRYALDFAATLTEDEYEVLGEDYAGCSIITVTRRTPAPQKEATTVTDTVTLRIPARVADFFEEQSPDLAHSLDAMDRDMARALADAETRPHGKNGTVKVMTTTRTIAAAFLATLESKANIEFDADDADTKSATAALAYVQRCQTQGITPYAPPADYRMTDPQAQAQLDAEIAKETQAQHQRAAQEADNATHRAAWETLTREERATRTQELLDAACTVLGFQRTDTRNWLDMGSVAASVEDGRFYMEARRLADPTARPALDAARKALTAAGWTITDWGTHFYAQAPQQATEGPQERPAVVDTDPAPTATRWAPRDAERAPAPASVWVTTEGGERIEYAYIPNGDPARIEHFLNAARAIPTFRDISTQQAPTPPQDTYQGPAPVMARVEWTKTVRGHHKGVMRFPNGATYKITHITQARASRGAKGDHLARPATGAQPEEGPAITWGLADLAAECAQHAGYTGPVTIEQTGRHRLARR